MGREPEGIDAARPVEAFQLIEGGAHPVRLEGEELRCAAEEGGHVERRWQREPQRIDLRDSYGTHVSRARVATRR